MRDDVRGFLAHIGGGQRPLAWAVAALLLLGISGPLYQLGLVPLKWAYAGIGTAAVLAAIATVLAVAALLRASRRRSRSAAAISALGVAIALFTIIVPARAVVRARSAPPLHDISTDLQDPPAFRTLSDVQPASSLPRPPRTDALQRSAYPDIGPLLLPVPSEMAFEEVLETFAELDWPVADGSSDAGIVEATVRSPWFGFRDDIVVRLVPVEGQTRVDVRSVSRDGLADAGRNAEHVREFLEELQR